MPSRRDFLRGRTTAGASAAPAGEGYTLQVGRRAMACQFEICLNAGQYPHGEETAIEALDLVESIEAQLSFFRAGSDITRINLLAANEPVEIDTALFELLCAAREISLATEGALDLTATPLWEVWGFARRQGAMPPEGKIADALAVVGHDLVELDPQRHTVRFLKPGVRLNLGAIGKGYAVDRCAELLRANGIEHFLVSGGYSSMAAQGEPAGAPPPPARKGWSVGVRNPLRPDRRLAEVHLIDRALGTSGSYLQSFRFEGKTYGHILDPRTGRPAEGMLSTTVLAPSAMLADALSTAFYVLGLEKTRAYCQRHPEVGTLLITPSRGRGGWQPHAINLGPDQCLLPAEPPL